MKYKLNVSLNDKIYLEYNTFWATRSHYGKKQMVTLRVLFALFIFVMLLFSFFGGFSLDILIADIPMLVLLVLWQLLLVPVYKWMLRLHIKSLKKRGKVGYSPTAVMEFFEENFVEITPENRNEVRYSAVERVSVVDNKVIYLHVNNLLAYILPFECFESEEQRKDFLEFVGTKCGNIDVCD